MRNQHHRLCRQNFQGLQLVHDNNHIFVTNLERGSKITILTIWIQLQVDLSFNPDQSEGDIVNKLGTNHVLN